MTSARPSPVALVTGGASGMGAAIARHVIAISAQRASETAPLSFMSTHVYGGAIERVNEHATAMSHRTERFNYMVSTTWTPMEDAAALCAWQDDYLAEIAAHASDAAYLSAKPGVRCDPKEVVTMGAPPRG